MKDGAGKSGTQQNFTLCIRRHNICRNRKGLLVELVKKAHLLFYYFYRLLTLAQKMLNRNENKI